MSEPLPIESAEVVLPCAELEETLAFFTERLGFTLQVIFPAEDPAVAVVAGHGVRLRLQRGASGGPGTLRLACPERALAGLAEGVLEAPNGTRVELVAAHPPARLPPLCPEFVLSRLADEGWGAGRVGMQYRDLVPGRQGGRFIASHIRVPLGGPVADVVHYHRVRFQMIYCVRGWVRVVYEDQGPSFVLQAGDAVLQPPQIRHRVLECSAGLEVVEVGCPADHETRVDAELGLPTARARPDREFQGQRFVRHRAERAAWSPSRWPGFEARDLGISIATAGLAEVQVLRPGEQAPDVPHRHDAELLFRFVLNGSLCLRVRGGGHHVLAAGDAVVVPAEMEHSWGELTRDLEVLQVTLPAEHSLDVSPSG